MVLQVAAEATTEAASTPVRDHEVMEAAVRAHLLPADPVPLRRLARLAIVQQIATTRTKDLFTR